MDTTSINVTTETDLYKIKYKGEFDKLNEFEERLEKALSSKNGIAHQITAGMIKVKPHSRGIKGAYTHSPPFIYF